MKKALILLGVLVAATVALAGVAIKDKTGVKLGSQHELKCGYGIDCSLVNGDFVMKPSLGNSSDSTAVFASGDTTPAVDVGGPFFKTFLNNAVTITNFTGANIYPGQEIIVMSQGGATLDVTASGIICGTTDIVMTSGDLTKFMYDGGKWRCESYIDQGKNLN